MPIAIYSSTFSSAIGLAYLVWGTRFMQTSAGTFLRSPPEIALPVMAQLLVTLLGLVLLRQLLAPLPAAIAATGAGLAVVALLLARFTPALRGECRSLLRAVIARAPA